MGECIMTRRGGGIVTGTAIGIDNSGSHSGNYPLKPGIYIPDAINKKHWVVNYIGYQIYISNSSVNHDKYISRLSYENGVYICDYYYQDTSKRYADELQGKVRIGEDGGIKIEQYLNSNGHYYDYIFFESEYQYFAW